MTSKKNYLYVGCGHHRITGFTHVEINIGKQFKKQGDVGPPDIIADITQHIPLKDNSVDLIFSRATLEHLTYQELINHFLECHRLIKKEGYIRMTVPDVDIMISNYLNKNESIEEAKIDSEISSKEHLENHTDLFISRILYHDHYYLHNFDTLSRALMKTGFTNIKNEKPGQTQINEVAEELYKAEKGRDKYEIIIEAQKLDDTPNVSRYPEKKPDKLILRILAQLFNINISRYNKRKPAFPTRLWFLEKLRKLKL
jgi:predicted SAM-dependent methyltransferase